MPRVNNRAVEWNNGEHKRLYSHGKHFSRNHNRVSFILQRPDQLCGHNAISESTSPRGPNPASLSKLDWQVETARSFFVC
jgi:hypothetical protein